MNWLGIDVGGANLKMADGRGWAALRSFPLWRQPEGLAAALGEMLANAPEADAVAVTMTGELADCFETKREGVEKILHCVSAAAGDRPVRVYLTNGAFCEATYAVEFPLLAAAANWHALATFAGRYAPRGTALLIDIGSTTTDIIPLLDCQPMPAGRTDPERLAAGELVYTGVQRSPVCALVSELPCRGQRCPVAQELFATTLDAYLLLGNLPDEPENMQTADGRPATKGAAQSRLARMVCADRELLSESDALAAAKEVRDAQLSLLEKATKRVLGWQPRRPETIVLSGRGEFLGRRLCQRLNTQAHVVSLEEQLGSLVSRCAPAHALAALARELSI
jgi:probable H4MPT-linked C1 transfer pathway protein